MTRLAAATRTLALALTPLVATSAAFAHGGQFSGPPGGGPPPTILPVGTPITGPPVPGFPGAPGPTTPGGGVGRANSLEWTTWWLLERDALLRFRDRVESTLVVTGDVEGAGAVRPTEHDVRTVVVPRLLALAAAEDDVDLVTSVLVALGRVGSRCEGEQVAAIRAAIEAHMSASSQEVSETAVLSLGILGGSESIATLRDVLAAKDRGSKLLGRGSVTARTRAFAAFALGLAAAATDDPADRQRVALSLVNALSEPRTQDELPTAAVISLGLCPVPLRPTLPPADIRGDERIDTVVSRAGQIMWLERWTTGARRDGRLAPKASIAHAQVALARLAAGIDEESREQLLRRRIDVVTGRKTPLLAQGAAVIALGELARAGSGPADVLARETLELVLTRGQPLPRRFATIALASASSRPGLGDDALEGAEAARRKLLRAAASARSDEGAWAGLALGLQAYRLARHRRAGARDAGDAILDLLHRERNARDIGAFAIGAALTYLDAEPKGRNRAGRVLEVAFDRVREPGALGHVSVALGTIRHLRAAEDLKEVLAESRFQPALHWSAAVALGMLGETSIDRQLLDGLRVARSGMARSAAAVALGTVGRRSSMEPLLELVESRHEIQATRAFAVIGLGILCDDDALPWRMPIAHALPWFAVNETLTGNANGLLDVL